MRGVEIQPFAEEHVDAAAALLEGRHARQREAEPLLPENINYRAEVEAAWQAECTSGVVALGDGMVVGYLLGSQRDESWGPNVWVEHGGHAVEEPELVRDLYAVAAANWVEEGRTRHYVLVPATDQAVVDAWFRLSFGAQHAAGIQKTPELTNSSASNVVVRRAVAGDVEAATALDLELPRHQERSPVFSPPAPTTVTEEDREQFLSEIDDPEVALFIAEIDEELVGELLMVPVERSSSMHVGLARPERAAFLTFAATLPAARGSGAGLALTNAGLTWAREHDYPVTVVDWRETNLLASRFWPRRGFRRTFLRLYRSIP